MKLRLTTIIDWELDPKNYRKGTTPEQMAEWEKAAVEDDPTLLIWLAENGTMTVTSEVIP